jgi:hypothetical protein
MPRLNVSQIQKTAFSISMPPRGELWPALKSRRLPAVSMRHSQVYCLATRG